MQSENDRENIGVVSIALTCSAYKHTTEDSNAGIYLLSHTQKVLAPNRIYQNTF